MTDRELIDRARRGDQRAFAELVSQYRSRLWSVCYRITNDRQDAEDALQNALTAAWQNLHKYRGEASFGTWAYVIAANSSKMIVRARRDLAIDLHSLDLADEQADHAERTADRDAINAALATLSDDFRAVLVLREYTAMPYNELAAHLGIPVQTVRSRLSRARAQLARALAQTYELAGAA
ncbi:sigma-70 family RNA polymerase sigma factor [Hoyosella sp. G463]|uniref:Sigma-70 family RNA polymerase sigma factor n=1 Tax=Lolliginicoccus lacisalsi TaxID=2742202 RepID=A0A927J9L2_9ACTN|nr:sigma-70 family RNA polymerase sigma factor [Lolliginicoccus lacisalsi]